MKYFSFIQKIALGALLSVSGSMYALDSVTLVVTPGTPKTVLSEYEFEDSGDLVFLQPEISKIFNNSSSAILTSIRQEAGYTSFLHKCYYNLPGKEGLQSDVFLVMSPNVYDNYEKKVYPINEEVNFAQWTLSLTDSPWKIKRIEIDALNYGMVNTYDNGQYSSGTININGISQTLPKNTELTTLGFDFEGKEQNISEIVLNAPKSASVGIKAIRIIPASTQEFINTGDFSGKLDYNPVGTYTLPYAKLGFYNQPDMMAASIINSEGEIMDLQYEYLGDNKFKFSPSADATPIEEGLYSVCYYYPDQNNYKPAYADGLPFSIVPSPNNLCIMLNAVDYDNHFCEIPENVTQTIDGEEVTYTWTNALITGYRPGTTIYWKVYIDDSQAGDETGDETDNSDESESNNVKSSWNIMKEAEADNTPEGYTRLNEQGVNLTTGNVLSLILERNGARSDAHDFTYTNQNIETSVSEISLEGSKVKDLYFTPSGLNIPVKALEDYSGIYIHCVINSNGDIVTKKLVK